MAYNKASAEKQWRTWKEAEEKKLRKLGVLEFLQDHNAVLITTESDLRYELYIKGLEKHFLRRAAQKGLRLPW